MTESLDGGDLGQERKLYVRELVARFGYLLALNWNIGEENTQSSEQQLAMAMNLRDADPYGGHHIVVHTFPNGQEGVYPGAAWKPLAVYRRVASDGVECRARTDAAMGARLSRRRRNRGSWRTTNKARRDLGVPPDPGYSGFAGKDAQGRDVGYTLHDIRKYTLWGNLMAGGAGVEYYFGYGLPDNDLVAENFRSRDKSWDYGRIAIDFFHSQKIPVLGHEECRRTRRQREARQQPVRLREDERRVSRLPSDRRNQRVSICRKRAASSPWTGSIRATAAPLKKGSVSTRQRRCAGGAWHATGQSRRGLAGRRPPEVDFEGYRTSTSGGLRLQLRITVRAGRVGCSTTVFTRNRWPSGVTA